MSEISPELAGEGKGGVAEVAHMLGRRDLAMMARAAERGYPCDQTAREESIKVCREIMGDAKATKRTRLAAIKTLAALDALQLRDAHHFEDIDQANGVMRLKMERAAQGLPNDSVEVQHVIPPSRVMPMPDWMLEMRKAKGVG